MYVYIYREKERDHIGRKVKIKNAFIACNSGNARAEKFLQ